VSTLVAGMWSAAGQPSGTSERRGHRDDHRHQPGHVCRTPAVRRSVVPEAADGQSADGSGSLQLPLLSSRPALRPSDDTPVTAGNQPHPAVTGQRYTVLGSWLSRSGPVGKGAIPFALACFTVFLLAVVVRAVSLASPISTGRKTRRRKPIKELIRVSLLETLWTVGAGGVASALAG
jgi:hypothetical protein